MAFDPSDIQRVKDANDIVEVVQETLPLKRKGQHFWCCCPFHQEKTPSMRIRADLQTFHCFGCHASGDVIKYIEQREQLDFIEALEYLAARAHIELNHVASQGPSKSKKQRLQEVCAAAEAFFHAQLLSNPAAEVQAARDYLGARGFDGSIAKRWKLGFAPGRNALVNHLKSLGFSFEEMVAANVAIKREGGRVADRFFNRIMFPIYDVKGSCIAFGGRIIGTGEPKYLNSQETAIFHKSEVLYGLDKAKASMARLGEAIVVEGYTDVIALSEAGISHVVATLGTALTLRHIKVLNRHANKRIIYLFDGDEAGQRACERVLAFIDQTMTPEAGKNQIELFAITLPDGLDPADYVSHYGAEAFSSVLTQAIPLIEFGIRRRLARYDLNRPETRQQAALDALGILAPIKESLMAKDYALLIASIVHVREDDVLNLLAKLEPRPIFGSEDMPTQATHSQALNFMSQTNQAEQAPCVLNPDTLAPQQRKRLLMERRFLTSLAQAPQLAPSFLDPLLQVQWQFEECAQMAWDLQALLSTHPGIGATDLAQQLTSTSPVSLLLLAQAEPISPDKVAASLNLLYSELVISDKEEALSQIKRALQTIDPSNRAEYELTFKMFVDLQQEIQQIRQSLSPLKIGF